MDLINLKIYKIYHSKQQLFTRLGKNLRVKFVVLSIETKSLARVSYLSFTSLSSFSTHNGIVPDFA